MLSCFPAEGLSKTSKVSSSAIVVRMDNFVTRKPEARSKTTVYVIAKDRAHQFGGYLYKTEEMFFFCKLYNHVLVHTRKSSIELHLTSDKHKARKTKHERESGASESAAKMTENNIINVLSCNSGG